MAKGTFLVIGGGLVGAASALRLQRAGFSVTLVDPGDPRRAASFGNAGHVAAEQAEPLASPGTLSTFAGRLFAFGGPLDFRWRDVDVWAPFARRFIAACGPRTFERGCASLSALMRDPLDAWTRLLDLAGAPSLLQPRGHFVVWMSERAAARGRAAWAQAKTGAASFRDLDRAELDAIGAVSRTAPTAGIRFIGTGNMRSPQAARDALLAHFVGRGGKIVSDEIVGLTTHDAGIIAYAKSGETFEADEALIAAGAWSRALMKGLGLAVPLIAERGYSIQSAEHAWPEDLPAVIFEERALVVTRFDNGLRATSFTEIGRPGAPPDPRKWRALQRHVRDLGIAFSDTPDRWMGPRPTLPDFLPAIGRLERAPRILYAFGHQHLGLTLSAITSEIVEALALGAPPPVDLEAFRIERFS